MDTSLMLYKKDVFMVGTLKMTALLKLSLPMTRVAINKLLAFYHLKNGNCIQKAPRLQGAFLVGGVYLLNYFLYGHQSGISWPSISDGLS